MSSENLKSKIKNSKFPIGVFDSGIGGITVLNEIEKILPDENIIYVADEKYIPYGEKTLEEIFIRSEKITKFLIEKNCKIIVIACNTASAAALHRLRKIYSEINFVGMEPAVKPAAEQSKTKVVGVIATSATFQGELFHSVVERFASDVKVLQQPCPGLVQQIEKGELESAETEKLLRSFIEPMLQKNIDALVLACTHYPFVESLLKKICGEKVNIINPAPAVAKQVQRIVDSLYEKNNSVTKNRISFFTTGDKNEMYSKLKNIDIYSENILQVDI